MEKLNLWALSRLNTPLLRGGFSRRGDGVEFLKEFLSGGLQSVVVACYSAIFLLLCFIAFPVLSNNYSFLAVWIRVSMILCLVGVLLAVRFFRDFVLQYYSWIVGLGCAFLFSAILYIIAHPEIDAVGVGFGAMPVVMFGLFLMYGFLRLPVIVMISMGVFYSLVVCSLSAREFFGVGGARMILYLLCFNVLGALLALYIERRERALFSQSLLLRDSGDQLKARAELVERVFAEKMRLVAAINHDLRQPMSAAIANLDLLRRSSRLGGAVSSEAALDSAAAALSYLSSTLDHVLKAATMESDSEPFEVVRVDLNDLIGRVVASFEAEFRTRGLELRVYFPAHRVEVISDPGALARILVNLVENGLKYNNLPAGPGRGVSIRIKVVGATCLVDVCDTGVGIQAKDLNAIWEPYRKVGFSEMGSATGLGLGLFLVKASVARLKAHSISVRSRARFGSRFRLSLPGRVKFEKSSTVLDGRSVAVDWDRLVGAFVIVFSDERSSEADDVCGLLQDFDTVYVEVFNIEELRRLMFDSDRAIDAVIVCRRFDLLSSVNRIFEFSLQLFPILAPSIIILNSGNDDTLNCVEMGCKIVDCPLVPERVAYYILSGVDRNIQMESRA